MQRRAIYTILSIIVVLALIEVGFRLLGMRVHQSRQYAFRTQPKDCFLPDSLLGTRPNTGSFTATINNHLTYYAKHVSNQYDVTRFCEDSVRHNLPRVDFHGCSFTYGMGINDTDTYPYLWALTHPNFDVRNYGCPGYSTTEPLLILQQQALHHDLPNTIIINYLDIHDERNAGTCSWRQGLDEGFRTGMANSLTPKSIAKIENCHFPFASMVGDSVAITLTPFNALYLNFWGRNYLASVNSLEQALNPYRYSTQNPFEVSKALMLQLSRFCKANQVHLLVTTMYTTDKTKQMQKYLTQHGIDWVDISVDFANPINTNQPYDQHPSPLANKVFVEKLNRYLVDKKLAMAQK